MGPGQPQFHSILTMACSPDSLWGGGVCCLLYLYLLNLPSRPTHTCFDLLRLGVHGGGNPHSFSGPLLPAPARPAGKDFLGMVLPLATESQKQPSKICSKLGLQLTQITTDWPETLAYPLQPFSTNTPDVGEKTSFPWSGGS